MSYRFGSFNLRNIGLAALSLGNDRDLRKIAEIIIKEKLDVVAFQEVLSGGKAINSSAVEGNMKKSLLMELGTSWAFEWALTDVDMLGGEGIHDRRGEGYGFAWNTNRLRLPTSIGADYKKRVFSPRVVKNARVKKDLKRVPFYARFTPDGCPGGTNVEFRLICIHTVYGSDTSDGHEERRKELHTILEEVYPQVEDKVYGCNMPSYTIVLGDYNVELWRAYKESWKRNPPAYLIPGDSSDEVCAERWGGRVIKTFQDQLTTLKAKDDDSPDGNESDADSERGYSHDYDHASFNAKRYEQHGIKYSVRRIDAVRDYCADDFKLYRKTVSDHIPIVVELELNQP